MLEKCSAPMAARGCFWVGSFSLILQASFSLVAGDCYFPAIFNFGDSNSDTGSLSAAFLPVPPPNGESFYGKPMGRVSDGRLLVDFMAETLGLPYLSGYLDSVGSNFRHGANFATGGSTIRPQNSSLFVGGISPFSLDVQIWQFTQFKTRTTELHNEGKSPHLDNYPLPEDFSNGLYTLDIGQNDLSAGFRSMAEDQVVASIPDILTQFSRAVKQLYAMGARSFWIHNTGPIGCLPYSVIFYSANPPNNLDQVGCIQSQNEVAKEFNRQLRDRVAELRDQLPEAALTYVDVYTAKYAVISDAQNQGFTDPLKFCCGRHEGGIQVSCGSQMVVNGSEVYGSSCNDPSSYVSWDGVHYTQAANQWVADHTLVGSLTEPNVHLTQACYRNVGGR